MMTLGVIEGFYGREWSWAERKDMVDFLSNNHFTSYCYAPKADKHLRKLWAENWEKSVFDELIHLVEHCEVKEIDFCVGLSPLGLYQEWQDGKSKEKLAQRLAQIALLKPHGLALLFDDMQGDLPDLAKVQSEIVHFVSENIDVEQIVLCPSYYSFDPILEQLFGKMPNNYLQDLGKMLDPSIDIFWTGDKVISQEYPATGLKTISQILQRKPIIWDNSIVNDGKKTSPFLTVRSMYSAHDMKNNVKAVWVNPMNAPAISKIPLASLRFSGDQTSRFEQALDNQAGDLKNAILTCLDLMNNKGRDQLNKEEIQLLNTLFRSQQSPIAQNIIAWLDGAYQFDPNCLT